MDERTKKSLDNVIKEMQELICVEYNKVGRPDSEKVTNYLIPILIINREFGTNYSLKPLKYNITKLLCEEK